eukprot:TRINITY_DN47279_c0_g1_i1.p1 TRINITY_DN47279_c0_g1~~TRINITY_DN47279_c0_g1_i1.p1  ORF type:complete len:621 (-),score=337.72 TRINITY_DN47279_c0_g1_i1:49-1731(-)
MSEEKRNAAANEALAWQKLAKHVEAIEKTHLRDLLKDANRDKALVAEFDGVVLDYSRQRVTAETMDLLYDLAEETGVARRVKSMAAGEHINVTEDRAVMHLALRAAEDEKYVVDGTNVVEDVHKVLKQIEKFSSDVRSGKWVGVTGKPIKNVVAIGIGGSYLGAEFVSEALSTDPDAHKAAEGRSIRFLANVDPIAVKRALEGLDAAETMAIVLSKTFTTAETMLNARTVLNWLTTELNDQNAAKLHMVACSAFPDRVEKFGIDPVNTFAFWDWVGGRYSVTSSVGLLPLALQYGFDIVQQFLAGARSIDRHFQTAPPRANLPYLLGLLGVWNSSFLKYPARALACYNQSLHKFAPHIQQVDMESNGKRVDVAGKPLEFEAGEINFGEPGTNGQHSFFQLFHQGRVVPVDFIGFIESQHPIRGDGEEVSNHDELMSNFFAQPDALAEGQNAAELRAEGTDEAVVEHKLMTGNRPSNVLLLEKLNAYSTGQLLALYEHRTAVQGFVWGINSFDQFGVELGKKLGKKVRSQLAKSRADANAEIRDFNPSTVNLLKRYLAKKQ